MKSIVNILFAVFLMASTINAQEVVINNDCICWDSLVKLMWEDFQGSIDSTWNVGAVTSTIVEGKGFLNDEGMPDFIVTNCFHKKGSWARHTTDELLEHEQLHFDIGEVYARKIRSSIDSLHELKAFEIDIYTGVIQKYLMERDKLEELYDKETAHGTRFNVQRIWSEKVEKTLELLEKYSSANYECSCSTIDSK